VSKTSVFGELQGFIDDPTIEEVWINSPNRIFVAKNGASSLTNLVLKEADIHDLLERLLIWGGRRLDVSNPFVDARLPDGSRLHAAIPEVTAKHWSVNIRKHLMRGNNLSDLVNLGVMSEEISKILISAVICGANILVSGGTQAGKTTLLNALASEIPSTQRVITIEEVFELKPNLPDCVALQTRNSNLEGFGEITLRKLIKEALRMRPARIIVGEVREAEALDLLISLNSGLPGMATIHANSAKSAIHKLQLLPLLAGENITQSFINPTISESIDVVVQCNLEADGHRRITEITALSGRYENNQIEMDQLFKWNGTKYIAGVRNFSSIFDNKRKFQR
jgi:pilus assembly protein CpaF